MSAYVVLVLAAESSWSQHQVASESELSHFFTSSLKVTEIECHDSNLNSFERFSVIKKNVQC